MYLCEEAGCKRQDNAKEWLHLVQSLDRMQVGWQGGSSILLQATYEQETNFLDCWLLIGKEWELPNGSTKEALIFSLV